MGSPVQQFAYPRLKRQPSQCDRSTRTESLSKVSEAALTTNGGFARQILHVFH